MICGDGELMKCYYSTCIKRIGSVGENGDQQAADGS